MGVVIDLQQHRERRTAATGLARRVDCFFDLSDPAGYLAFERVERLSASIDWRPATLPVAVAGDRVRLEARARELRLPLVWPERTGPVPRAMRAAAFAAEHGRGAQFALAASRLAFCGGFDLEDPEVLAEAAAAAGLGLDDALAAAADGTRDAAILFAGRLLAQNGVTQLPVVKVGRTLFDGERRVADAGAALRSVRASASQPA